MILGGSHRGMNSHSTCPDLTSAIFECKPTERMPPPFDFPITPGWDQFRSIVALDVLPKKNPGIKTVEKAIDAGEENHSRPKYTCRRLQTPNIAEYNQMQAEINVQAVPWLPLCGFCRGCMYWWRPNRRWMIHRLIVSHSHSAGPDDCKPCPMAPMGRAPRF